MVTPLAKTAAAVLFAAPVALLSACAPPGQVPATTPGTNPPIWTGSPAPSTPGATGHEQEHGTVETEQGALEIPMLNAAGQEVATATFAFSDTYATVTVKTAGPGKLTPGFHGMHIHSVGKCEANSKAPDGTGEPGAFLSAGGHFQAPGHTGSHSSGDLTSLNVRADGSALLVTTTDAVTQDEISGGKTALIIHEGADNFANIPTRYQAEGVPGPDAKTKATGDAGNRVACGVIGAP